MASSCSKKLLVLLRELTAEHYDDFHCLSYLHSFRTKKKLESHQKVFENKDLCKLIMPSEDIKILNSINIKNLVKHYLLFIQIVNG